jgi:aspartate aminotransferase
MGVIAKAGFEWDKYRYYDRAAKQFDCTGMLEDLDRMDNESIVLLQVCAHNPTGCDPTQDQWRQILEVVKRKGHFAAFDNAYQGFATGDLENDSFSIRTFAEQTDRICLFQSFAKNFGLYGERAGCVSFLCADEAESLRVQSRIKQVARPMYSSPPIHGARIVDIILNDPELFAQWQESLDIMSGRLKEMRGALVAKLAAAGSQHDWGHITTQIGMFAYTGLNTDQVNKLKADHHIYMTGDGRISVAGLNSGNIDYVASAFHEVSK